MANRFLQLKRNATIFDSYSAAVETVTKDTFLADKKDGEVISIRYKNLKGGVSVAVGHVVDKNGQKSLFISDVGNAVSEVSVDQVKLTTNYNDSSADLYRVSATTANGDVTTDNFQLTYTPYSPLALKVPTTIGDIEKGTNASDLNGKNISKILDDIIFPTIYPALTDPTASLVFNADGNANTKTMIVGSTIPALKANYTKGAATVNDGVTGAKNYTNDLTNATFKYQFTAGTASTSAGVVASGTSVTTDTNLPNTTVTTAATNASGVTTTKLTNVGTYKFKATVNYAAGDKLQTSKGATPDNIRYESLNGAVNTNKSTKPNPHPVSTVDTSLTCQINSTLPFYATTANTSTFAQLALTAWGAVNSGDTTSDSGNWRVTFPATSAASPIKIKAPRKLCTVNALNPTSGKYDVLMKSNFTETTTTETINGTTYTYYLYTWTGAATSSGKYKITCY